MRYLGVRSFLIRAYRPAPGINAARTLPPNICKSRDDVRNCQAVKSVGTDALPNAHICTYFKGHSSMIHYARPSHCQFCWPALRHSLSLLKLLTYYSRWVSVCQGGNKLSKAVGGTSRTHFNQRQVTNLNSNRFQRRKHHVLPPSRITRVHLRQVCFHITFKLNNFYAVPLSFHHCALYHSSSVAMAGHNKWSKVKHKKKLTDLEKSKNIHKFVNQIVSAIKVGGGADPDANVRLANVIDAAKKAGVPKANIDNAIKIGSGKGGQLSSELVVYEAQGPSGYHMIIEAFTDNNRKTRPEIKNLLAKYSGILGEYGSSAFMFDHKGVVRVSEGEIEVSTDVLEVAIEAGAEDVYRDSNVSNQPPCDSDTEQVDLPEDQYVKFVCNPSELTKVSRALESLGYTVASANLEYLPKSLVSLGREAYENALKLVCALSEHSNVTEVYDNFTLEATKA